MQREDAEELHNAGKLLATQKQFIQTWGPVHYMHLLVKLWKINLLCYMLDGTVDYHYSADMTCNQQHVNKLAIAQ